MSDTTQNAAPDFDKQEHAWNLASGWGGLIIGVLALHRWVAEGVPDQFAKAGLIFAVGLTAIWAWGYWPLISQRMKQWVRGGGLHTTLVAVGLILCLIIVNTLARRRLPARWDLTKNQRFTLAPRTREILKGLKTPVTATVFIPAGRNTSKAKDLFNQYKEVSDKFTWTHVDPMTNITEVLSKKINLSADLTGAILEANGKRETVTDFTEKAVTGAILKLTRDTVRKIYFLEGHGEMSPTALGAAGASPRKSIQVLTEELKSAQWETDKINLFGKDVKTPDPAQVAVIVVDGPEKELAPEEAKRLNEYLNAGGRVLLLLSSSGPSYSQFLQPWGINTTNDLILDRSQDNGLVVVEKPEAYPALKDIGRLVFPAVRSVQVATPAPKGITLTPLIKSGQFTVQITNFQPGKPISLAGAKPGPFTLGVLAEKTGTGQKGRKGQLVVLGDASFATDMLARFQQFYNVPLVSSLVNSLGEEEDLVSIPPKDENTEQAFLTPSQGRMLLLIHFLDFPLLALLLAVIVYLKRR